VGSKNINLVMLGDQLGTLVKELYSRCSTAISSVAGVAGGEQTSRHRVGCFVQSRGMRSRERCGVESDEESRATRSRERRGLESDEELQDFHLVEKLKCTQTSSR
ncbi:hypothetical protein Drorol1_Dr00023383, partial [Drosera rotundifolia]